MSERLKTGLQNEAEQPTFDIIDEVKGTALYNFEQQKIKKQTIDFNGKEKIIEVYVYNSLRVDAPITANTIMATLINELYPAEELNKMMNDYNAANMGIEDESKAQPYINFLKERKRLLSMVEKDCLDNDYPLK